MSRFEFFDEGFDTLPYVEADEICKAALEEAAPVMVESMKKSARAAVMHEGESDMVNSIKANKPKLTKDGDAYITNVGPTGSSNHQYYDKKSNKKRKYKVSNALKAIWKEYGIEGQQSPRPFITKATNDAEPKVNEIIQKAYERMMGGK